MSTTREDLTSRSSLKMPKEDFAIPDEALGSKINREKRKMQNTEQDYAAFMNVSKSTTNQDADDQSREASTLKYSEDSIDEDSIDPDAEQTTNHFRTLNIMKRIMVDGNHHDVNDKKERRQTSSIHSRASTVKNIVDAQNVKADDVRGSESNTARSYSRRSNFTTSTTQSSASRLSSLGQQHACDVCEINENFAQLFCSSCCQKMCEMCLELHGRYGGSFDHVIDPCFSESSQIDASLLALLQDQHELSFRQMVCYLYSEIGLQICANYLRNSAEILAPNAPALELAVDTIRKMAENRMEGDNEESEVRKRVHHGLAEWIIRGRKAKLVLKLFIEDISAFLKKFEDVNVSVVKDGTKIPWNEFVLAISRTNQKGTEKRDDHTNYRNTKTFGKESLYGSITDLNQIHTRIIVSCSPNNFYEADCEIQEILDEVQTVITEVVMRSKVDGFRIKIYALFKESDRTTLCQAEDDGGTCKLIIQSRSKATVEATKQEFLSLFCKECSSCHLECDTPTYMDCKHVLCTVCLRKTDNSTCYLCQDHDREKTPVTSLKIQAIQAIDKAIDERARSVVNKELSVSLNKHFPVVRKKNSLKKPHNSVKIPKYLINKWRKSTGGVQRLRSLIENNFGLNVGGSDDNLQIYGEQQEVLELATHTLVRLNERQPVSGVTVRLADGAVEWRMRGEFAQIAFFLFNDHLDRISGFKSVKVKSFIEVAPTIVDVKCGYREFPKVKYEMEELENDIKNLFTDEYIQPRNFYYNIKVKEYLNSKRRDSKVHCSLAEKNNLNVIVIKGRKKEYVSEAKDQLSQW